MSEEGQKQASGGGVFDGITPTEAPAEAQNQQDPEGSGLPNSTVIDQQATPGSEALAAFHATAVPEGVLGDKFKTVGDVLKGYQESSGQAKGLAEKLKGFGGAPVDEAGEAVAYAFEEVEGFENFTVDEGLMAAANEIGRKHGASQEFMQEMMGGVYMPAMQALGGSNQEGEMARLTEVYQSEDLRNAKLNDVFSWATKLLPDESPLYEGRSKDVVLREAGASAVVPIVLDLLQSAFHATTLPIGDPNNGGGMTEEEYVEGLRHIGEGDVARDAQVVAYAERKSARQQAGNS